jgi:anti-sigma regulatory factor (Ser/Thr protein kinase)
LSESAHNQRLTLDAKVTAPRQARDFLAAACSAWRAEQFIAPASLVLSELVSNAVMHAGTALDVQLRLTDDVLLLSVHDTGPGMPPSVMPQSVIQQPGQPDLLSVGGHGLDIVSQMSETWGVAPDPGKNTGKSVWCLMRADESC